MSAGDFEDSERCLMSAQRLSRKRRSLRSSSSLAPEARGADDEASGGLRPFSLRRISFRRRRSLSDSILRETPVWLTVGMKTRKRPGQRDVRGDACALTGDGLLGDLDEDLLAGLEEFADGGKVGRLHGAAATTAVAASTTALTVAGASGIAGAVASTAKAVSSAAIADGPPSRRPLRRSISRLLDRSEEGAA